MHSLTESEKVLPSPIRAGRRIHLDSRTNRMESICQMRKLTISKDRAIAMGVGVILLAMGVLVFKTRSVTYAFGRSGRYEMHFFGWRNRGASFGRARIHAYSAAGCDERVVGWQVRVGPLWIIRHREPVEQAWWDVIRTDASPAMIADHTI